MPDLGEGGAALALSSGVALALLTLVALTARRPAGTRWRPLVVGLLAAAFAARLTAVAPEAVATPAKAFAAACLGYALAGMLDAPWQLGVIAVLAMVVDIASVAAGPTRLVVEGAPDAFAAVALHLPAFGRNEAALVGSVDMLFLATFVGGATRLGMRSRPTALVCLGSLVATLSVASAIDRGLPALPLMAVGVVAVNGDLMLRSRDRPLEGAPGP